MMRIAFVFIPLFNIIPSFAQITPIIRGNIIDNVLNEPIAFATVVVLNSHPSLSATTDSLGNFTLNAVPIGRYDLQVTCAGYKPTVIREVILASIKEKLLTIKLKQQVTQLNEIEVKLHINKQHPLHSGATLSAKVLSVEEAKRYAGSFDDPARLVSAFAGVSSNVGNNAVRVRGNSPQSLQWKLEGIEIPNPNHMADLRDFGGGTVTALSAQLLTNSDFFSGAMPAEFNNALSGVFDMSMRKGNNQKHEQTLQIGVVGIDAAAEGPFKQGGKSSYLFNYRYSTLGLVAPLLADNAGGINYQDLSFKLNFPTKKAGVFSIWGLGLIDHVAATAKQDVAEWVYDGDRENHDIKQCTGATGISHNVYFNKKYHLSSTLASTFNRVNYPVDRLDSSGYVNPKSLLNNKYHHLVLSSSLNTKFNAKHSNKTGFTLTNMRYNVLLQNEFTINSAKKYVVNETGQSSLISAYTTSTLQLSGRTIVNAGINAQLFTLNNTYRVEPRLGIKHQISNKHTLAFAYGLHSRLERLNYYFIKNSAAQNVNAELSPTKAHHLVLGYDINTSTFTNLKIETYYQYLFDVPVIANSSFSMLNLQNDWFLSTALQNKGKGKNYGIEFTFDKYLSNGYYYMANASLFRSIYQGGDGIWRNTRYNRNFVFNFLLGKEWFLGKNKQNLLGANVRVSYQGGDRYSPVENILSLAKRTPFFDESKAFSVQYPSAFTSHFTASYQMNKEKASHQIALSMINIIQHEEYIGFRYNYQTKKVDLHRELVIIPNLSYRIDF